MLISKSALPLFFLKISSKFLAWTPWVIFWGKKLSEVVAEGYFLVFICWNCHHLTPESTQNHITEWLLLLVGISDSMSKATESSLERPVREAKKRVWQVSREPSDMLKRREVTDQDDSVEKLKPWQKQHDECIVICWVRICGAVDKTENNWWIRWADIAGWDVAGGYLWKGVQGKWDGCLFYHRDPSFHSIIVTLLSTKLLASDR